MSTSVGTACLILVLSATLAAAAEAQRSDPRSGLWITVGAGPGSVRATCSVCDGIQPTGLSGQAGVGGTISPRLVAGAEGAGWTASDAGRDRSFWMASALGVFYPVTGLGLHVQAGVGGYRYAEETAATRLTTQGLALQVGAGYDIPITAGVAVTPFGALVTSGFGNPVLVDKASNFNLPLLSDMKVRFFHFGVAATLR